ncbi:hypothetical protein CesoFtcFv8_009307 [Champsocephalus esox]|uniref:Uncharacterized protein n=1 Tax=Champsocephalus esox TaxID=159716 RepID=A0AAN8CA16_9TELE|nr:hypothetical protein CesoFtcFv8_009307 [Champsocephalus esox]
MEASSQSRDGGLWNKPRATQYSQQTQDLLKLMMQESRLNNLQRKQINQCLQNGAALPLNSDPTPPSSPVQLKTSKHVQKYVPWKPQRRSAESCRSDNSYVREKFCPGPSRDLEKEKRRLQNILATGEEEPKASHHVSACRNQEVAEQRDRYQIVVDEIQERRQFLAEMGSLGQERQFTSIINSEISQRIRELQVLEKTRSLRFERQVTEKMEIKETEEEKTHCH